MLLFIFITQKRFTTRQVGLGQVYVSNCDKAINLVGFIRYKSINGSHFFVTNFPL